MLELKKSFTLTYWIPQSKVIALGRKYGEESSLAEATVRTGDDQREDANDGKHARFGDEDAPEERPDDVAEVQQDHVLEEQRREGELGHKIPQTFGLSGGDDVGPPCDVATQYDAKALQESWQELVYGHGGGGGGGRAIHLLEDRVQAAGSAWCLHHGPPLRWCQGCPGVMLVSSSRH